jgi:small-conductance mechanosensitive channel/TolA-binding protein
MLIQVVLLAAVIDSAVASVAVAQRGAASATQADPKPAAAANTSPPPQTQFPLVADQVAAHLGETVDWFHHLAPIEQLQIAGADSSTRDKLHQQSLMAVRLAFQFGKACAVLLDAQSRLTASTAATGAPAAKDATGSKGSAGRLDQAAADVAQRINDLQSQLDSLKGKIASARGKERETLVAQQEQANAALRLAREVQGSVQDMEDFEASSIAGDNGNLSPLDGQIADMERSIPELRAAASMASRARSDSGGNSGAAGAAAGNPSAKGTAASGTAAANATNSSATSSSAAGPANAFRVESAGVIALLTEWFSLHDTRRQLSEYVKETGDLQDEIERVRAPLVNEARLLVGDDLAISTLTDPAALLAQRQALEAHTARFKQLATVLVPLGEQALTVESAMSTLDDWNGILETRMASVARHIAIRIGIVLGWIAVVLIISEIWRRGTFRYLHDLRRRRQFLVLRRVAVAIALTLVIVFGLVSEIGSIATYIGFVTAGIAVALQNVILAVVAYFFLIGRYGVRVGDRVTLAGVTGRVVDIGLVRIYLMELAGADLHVTGRMMVLSNAVLFQPTALFKQIPGADYVWHTVTLTIAATADVLEAHKRLKAAAEAVYEKYRAAIERQHAVVQRFIDFDASSPQPEVRVRLTENGLECSVRYPVELENAAVTDQQMLKALRDALEHDAQFKLVATGAVVLKSSDT